MDVLSVRNLQAHIKDIYRYIQKEWRLSVLFGVEIEFYLRNEVQKAPLPEQIRFFEKLLLASNIELESEKGLHQYEIKAMPLQAIECITQIQKYKDFLIKSAKRARLDINFSPKPFRSTYGSAMQFNISVVDSSHRNAFVSESRSENKQFLNIIYALLENLNNSLYLICKDDEREYERLNSSGFMSPTTISWGGNNRTTAIRIPDTLQINKRIEFRVPSANARPDTVIFYILLSIVYSFKYKTKKFEKIYGNAHDEQYNLETFHGSAKEAYENFHLDIIYKDLLSQLYVYDSKIIT